MTRTPSSPEVGSDGQQRRDDDGKRKYLALMAFSGDGKARREKAVLTALADAGIAP